MKRITYIDYFRCAGIILMIMGHIGFGGKFDRFIHAFHMPMFFFCSGMCYKAFSERGGVKGRSSYLRKKAYKLLMPYFFFGIGHYTLWLISNYHYNNYLSPLVHLLWDNTEGLPYAGALWFLTAFYSAQLIYYFIDMLEKQSVKNVVITAIAVLGCEMNIILPFRLPWALSAALVGVGLIHAGRLFASLGIIESFGKSFKKELPAVAVGCIAVTFLIFKNGHVNMRIGEYSYIILFWFNAVVVCILGLYMACVMEKLIRGKRRYEWLDGYIRSVGEKSIIYLCLNQIVILALRKAFGSIDVSTHGIAELGWRLSLLTFTLAVLYFASRFFLKYGNIRCLIGTDYNAKFFKRFCIGCFVVLCLSLTVAHVKYEDYKTNEKIMLEKVMTPVKNLSSTENELYSQEERSCDAVRIARILEYNIGYLINEHLSDVTQYALEPISNIKLITAETKFAKTTHTNDAESIENWKNGKGICLVNAVGGGENAIRPWAHTCYVLASCINFDICDFESTGLSRMEIESMTIELIAELADKHCSNYYGGWGDCWQSALWSENISFAAWILWDRLPESVQVNVINMLTYEADRFLDYKIPYYRDVKGNIVYEGDSKGEENAWNSRILALASCMLPEHSHARVWEQKMEELLLSSTAAPDNVESTIEIDGYSLCEVLDGSNIESDGTVVNHNLHHLDYSTVIVEGMLDTAIIYTLAGRKVPETVFFNQDRLYRALVETDLGVYDERKKGAHFFERTEEGAAGIEVNMPGENDWGGKWYASYYLMDTAAELFYLDKECPEGLKAEDWAVQHLYAAESQAVREYDGKVKGQYFGEGENFFVSGETYMMQNMCKAYLLRMLFY